MDISAILPVNMGNDSSSLNDDFSAQTASGDNIFSKPFGARTFFRTASKGLVCVSFIFDPKKLYGEDHNMASVTSDWMADLRDALTRELLDAKDIAPKTKSLEETIWDQITSLMPKEAVAKNLFTDKKAFETYTELLKKSVTRNFVEEDCLTKEMTSKKFSFSFEIAIDAYPQELGGNDEKKTADKSGVLTFNITGIPDGKIPPPEVEAEDSSSNRKAKKRKVDDKENGAKLIKELALTESYKTATVENQKKYPHTATQFFEMVNRWFSSAVSRRASKLEKDRNRNPLYH